MRGTRVDRLDNNRVRIVHFGHFGANIPSNEFNMSEKDAYNLCGQLNDFFARRYEAIEERGFDADGHGKKL